MKFIVDAQLPRRLARFLQDSGFDTIHTLDLPQQNATPDSSINVISITEERVVITKDADFVDSFLTIQQPYKLLLIATSQPSIRIALRNISINFVKILTGERGYLYRILEEFEQKPDFFEKVGFLNITSLY